MAKNGQKVGQSGRLALFIIKARAYLTPERTKFFPPGTHVLGQDPACCLGL
jgi:hypothetical protein